MSTSTARSPKKRSLKEYSGNDQLHQPIAKKLRPLESVYQSHFQRELQDAKASLEHVTQLRSLDQRRFQQTQSRLERQVQFAVDEANESRALLEEHLESSNQRMEQLQQARADALEQLRECQEQLEQVELENTAEGLDASLMEEKERVWQEQAQAQQEEIEALREQVSTLTQQQLASLTTSKNETSTPTKPDFSHGEVSPAPKEVLRELNKVRIELAESERKYRQLRRKSDDLSKKASQYIQEKEANRQSTARVVQVEQELRELRKEYEGVRASNQAWVDFQKQLQAAMVVEGDSSFSTKTNGPPEIATILRYLEQTKQHAQKLASDKASLQKSLDTSNERVIALESLRRDDAVIISNMTTQKQNVETQLESARQQVKSLQAQQGIWRREADGLRSLLKTFDDLPGSGKPTDTSAGGGATAKSLQVSLDTAKHEIQVLEKDRDRLAKELKSVRDEQQEQQTEHARVVEKFGKLREALNVEKLKVEEAENRADKAEALAGKGSFNTEETRVLHLQRNPLTEAIRERYEREIRGLQRQLEEATGQKPARGAAAGAGLEVDPQKLHQRLKQSFKEQIALFREGVYLMTGYKVDMLPNTDKPTFRVRSVYAEQEQDQLMFVCQKEGEEITSMDLVETDLAKLLADTDSYQYMTKFSSLPGFLASVQLSLFEKQTFIASS